MPIVYNKTTDSWEGVDLTDEERTSLVRTATESIVTYFGEEVASRIIKQAESKGLEDMPVEIMGNS